MPRVSLGRQRRLERRVPPARLRAARRGGCRVSQGLLMRANDWRLDLTAHGPRGSTTWDHYGAKSRSPSANRALRRSSRERSRRCKPPISLVLDSYSCDSACRCRPRCEPSGGTEAEADCRGCGPSLWPACGGDAALMFLPALGRSTPTLYGVCAGGRGGRVGAAAKGDRHCPRGPVRPRGLRALFWVVFLLPSWSAGTLEASDSGLRRVSLVARSSSAGSSPSRTGYVELA